MSAGPQSASSEPRPIADARIRPALADDAAAMASVQLAGWRTAYRGIFPDDVLDAADPAAATDKWRHRLAAPGAVAFVATTPEAIVAIAAGGPPGKEPRLDLDRLSPSRGRATRWPGYAMIERSIDDEAADGT